MKTNYRSTITACFIGYIVQAIVNNFVPLLFVTLQESYNIALSRITLLITLNFAVQLLVDFLSAGFIDKIGYRRSAVIANLFSAAGLILLPILPEVMDPFAGILTAVILYAIGGGLLEVLISPIVESCPGDNKSSAMSLLHSFYCWGHVGVVILSTLFFRIWGIRNWKILSLIWASIPIANALLFSQVPIAPLLADGQQGMTIRQLCKSKIFWVLMLMMACAGACEQAASQWASTFAEEALHIPKTVGDLAGPLTFALCMGCGRAIYGKFGKKLPLNRTMGFCVWLCVGAYLLISLSPLPSLSLIGFALCGFGVSILWPGTFSTASAALRHGGTTMFALLALAGDLGCSAGPTLVGSVAEFAGNNLKVGILSGIVFPILLFLCICGKKKTP